MSLTQNWQCQDNAASTTIVASVGTDASVDGGANTSTLSVLDGPGSNFPRSLQFSGASYAINISNSLLSFASTVPVSICAWMKFTSLATNQPLMGQGSGTSGRFALNNTPQALTTFTGSDHTWSLPALTTGVWQHVFFSRAASNAVRVFLSGVESVTGSITIAETFGPNYAGKYGNTRLNGKICDIRVYNSDESANVVAIMALAGLGCPRQSMMHLRRQR